MKRHTAAVLAVVLGLVSVSAQAQMVTGSGMKDFDQVFRLPGRGARPTFNATLLKANEPGCIYYATQIPELTFQVRNLSDQPMTGDATLDVIGYGTRGIPGDIWKPEVFLVAGAPGEKITLNIPAKGWKNFTLNVPIPDRFGGYAVVVDFPGRGRTLLATMVRAVEPIVPLVQYPSQALDGIDPSVLERMGIRAVRLGIRYTSPTLSDYAQRIADLDRQMQDYQKHHVTVVAEIGGHDHNPMPLGQPRPMLDSNGVMQDGKMDYAWLPSDDANFKMFVRDIVTKHGWPKGPITGFKLWNEPWEGSSISGWQADMLRFRELHKIMGDAVHEANRDAKVSVLVGGADSSTNTWDKFFPDGTDEFLPYLDFCSIHYQGLYAPVLDKLWHDRKVGNGRVLIWDTESWVANCDDRLGALVASNRAAGYDRCMGIYIGNVVTLGGHGEGEHADVFDESGTMKSRQVATQSWPPAAALCASQAMIGERAFKEILFKNGLPWVFCFDGMDGNADDGTIVIVGDLGELFAQTDSMLFRNVRSIAELDATAPAGTPLPFRGVSITIPADPDFSLYDFYANPVASENGKYIIPLDARGFFLRSDSKQPGSYNKLVQAISAGRIDGLEAVEIKALDFLEPVVPTSRLRLTVTNVLNRPIAGRFSADLAKVKAQSDSVKLDANETRTIEIAVAGLVAAPDNRYPMAVQFEGEKGERGEQRDTLRVNLIAHRTINVDADLADWKDALPQVIQETGTAKQTITEAAWLPMVPFNGGQAGGFATGYVAYDDQYFYFAAKIADNSKDPGTLRFEKRDDDAFFYPDVAIKKDKDGKTTELRWPEGVRHFSYRKDPILPAGCFPSFDNVQIAFNAIAPQDKADVLTNLPGRMPGFVPTGGTDYEYALNTVAPQYGGGFEVWRLRVPGMPNKNFYPRQPKDSHDGPVTNAKLVTRYVDNMRITELALPWSEIPHVKALMEANKPVKFSFRVNDNAGGPLLELARGRSVSRQNNLAFRTDWRESWANELEFSWEPAR